MGTQSIPHPHCSSYVPLRIVILLLLSATLSLSALAQTLALSIPLILPSAIVFDAAGNLYFAETANNLIRKVDTSGREGREPGAAFRRNRYPMSAALQPVRCCSSCDS